MRLRDVEVGGLIRTNLMGYQVTRKTIDTSGAVSVEGRLVAVYHWQKGWTTYEGNLVELLQPRTQWQKWEGG